MTYERTTVIHDHCLLEETILLYIEETVVVCIDETKSFKPSFRVYEISLKRSFVVIICFCVYYRT